jgi:hypothetical protein
MVLAEMRALLEAVHAVIVANNAGDMSAVATAGRKPLSTATRIS